MPHEKGGSSKVIGACAQGGQSGPGTGLAANNYTLGLVRKFNTSGSGSRSRFI